MENNNKQTDEAEKIMNDNSVSFSENPETNKDSDELNQDNTEKSESSGLEKTSFMDGVRNRTASAEKIIAEFITQNNIIARLIGIFLLFSAGILISNRKKESPVIPFDGRLNDPDTNKWKDFIDTVSFRSMIIFAVILFAAVAAVKKFIPKMKDVKIDSYILTAGIMTFGVSSLWRMDNPPFSFGVIIVSVILVNCLTKSDDFKELRKIPKIVFIILTALAAAAVIWFVLATTISRHRLFHTAVFDLGIFTQMYHSMITDFSLVTTCERGKELSHFAVHFSPIFYVLYPVYFLFPDPETLLASQGILVVSGVIPLYLICRKYGFSNLITFLFNLVYIFSASLISPCYYEFHENAFLPPLLMWFFYSIEKEKKILMYVFMVLLLMVKEDAALYVMCIALYLLLSGKNRRHGFIMLAVSGAVFVNVLHFMSKYGEGAMTNRTFGNLMKEYDGGFGEVIKTALADPAYFISQCFTAEKITFIIIMMLPLMFMPFITNKASRMLIVLPFIIMNLASGYAYASKFDYQYVFGTTSCLIYASLINIADIDKNTGKRIISFMAAASVMMSFATVTKHCWYIKSYKDNKENIERKQAYLDAVPEDGSVLTTAFHVPHIANRKEVYTMDENTYEEPDTCDFVVIDGSLDGWKYEKSKLLEEEGYELWAQIENLITIYVSPEYEFK